MKQNAAFDGRMKHLSLLLLLPLLLSGCGMFGPSEYVFDPGSSGSTAEVRTGDRILVILPSDRDPALFWKTAAPPDPKVLMRLSVRSGKIRKNDGPEFYAVEYAYRVVGPGFAGIALERNGKGGRERFNLLIRAEGEPQKAEDIFGEGEKPPDTMTDSKGNVVKKPKNLLD